LVHAQLPLLGCKLLDSDMTSGCPFQDRLIESLMPYLLSHPDCFLCAKAATAFNTS